MFYRTRTLRLFRAPRVAMAALLLAALSLTAEATTFVCQNQTGCTYRRIKDDGTLGPAHTKPYGHRLVINDGDYDLDDGWEEETGS